MTVGLTGGIGSGKTTVARMFSELGVPVYYSDIEAKRIMLESQEVKFQLIDLLGEEAYSEDGLNRKYIASKIFSNKELLAKINGIVHPAVRENFIQWRSLQESPYVIQESALIFENGYQDFYDKIILVTAPVSTRVARVLKRDGNTTEKEVRARVKNQLSDDEKIRSSHYVVENIDLVVTRKIVQGLHQKLCAQPDKYRVLTFLLRLG